VGDGVIVRRAGIRRIGQNDKSGRFGFARDVYGARGFSEEGKELEGFG
jgi:hypothetical protein